MEATNKEYLFGHIFLLANKLQALGDAFLTEMTLKQWLLLIVMFNMEKKEPSVTEIAESLGSTRQNVRKMLEALSERDYVTLGVNEQDKRNLSVALTQKTLQFFGRFKPRGDEFLAQLFDGIPEDHQDSTRMTVEALLNNVERMEKQYGKSN